MPIAQKVNTDCPRCSHSEAWLHRKKEGSGTKKQYECDECGCEWTEWE